MEEEKLKIQVIVVGTKQVLFECTLGDSDNAYQYAAQMEELGVDVMVLSPTIGESLSSSLGLSQEAKNTYQQSLEEEMDEHAGSCCFNKKSEVI